MKPPEKCNPETEETVLAAKDSSLISMKTVAADRGQLLLHFSSDSSHEIQMPFIIDPKFLPTTGAKVPGIGPGLSFGCDSL